MDHCLVFSSDAEAQLTELVDRAEDSDEVVSAWRIADAHRKWAALLAPPS